MTSAGLLYGLAGLNVLFGLVVFIQNRSSAVHGWFFAFSLACGLWVLTNGLFIGLPLELRLAPALLSYGAAMMLAVFLLLFCRRLCRRGNVHASGDWLIVLSGIAAASVASVPGVVASDVTAADGVQTNLMMLAAYAVVLVAYFLACIATLLQCIRANRHSRVRGRAISVLVGLCLATLVGLGCNLILPLLGRYEFVGFGPVGSIVLIAACGYAAVKHGLFDVKAAVVRSFTYGLTLAALLAVYVTAAYVLSVLVTDEIVLTSSIGGVYNAATALVLALLFQPLKQFFDRGTNRIFYRDRYDPNQLIADIGEVLSSASELDGMLKQAAHHLATALKTDQVFFIVAQAGHAPKQRGTTRHSRLPQADIERLDTFVGANGEASIVVEEMTTELTLRRVLVSHRIGLVIPLVRQGVIVGYVMLGEQLGSGYHERDLRVLDTLSDELIIALQNATNIETVKDVNAHLEQRIIMATAELRTTNARLKRLDSAKDEFLSVASHQLRTPLTSIKGYLSMVLEGDLGKITSAQRSVLEEAFSSSERMVHLIHDFLNVSRLQTGKFMLEIDRHDLSKIVAEEVRSLRQSAKSRDLTLKFHDTNKLHALELDDTKIRQVVMNYIDNAIYYSHPNTTIHITLSSTPHALTFVVEDTGIGVPKAEQEQLFEKFYRATNARKQRPDGTGVGLFLGKKIINAHGGTIIFSSKEGKGSTFGFSLPIKSGLQHEADQLADKQ